MMGAACARSSSPATVADRAVHGMSSEEALRIYRSTLTAYERTEIVQYPEVWFVGEGAKKIHGMEGMPSNCGFDDTNSRYLAKKRDHVAYRYEVLSGLGKGAFGDVYKALDHRTGELVALKVIRNEKRFHRQGKVEVKVLDMLRKQDPDYSHCCVHMIDYFIFRNHVRSIHIPLRPTLCVRVAAGRGAGAAGLRCLEGARLARPPQLMFSVDLWAACHCAYLTTRHCR